jgi:hypothetical protein
MLRHFGKCVERSGGLEFCGIEGLGMGLFGIFLKER